MKTDKKLRYELVKFQELSQATIREMYVLMDDNYTSVQFKNFCNDLSRKDLVILLKQWDGEIVGFTSHELNPYGTGTERYNILFSGDTIISPKAWGSLEIMRAWCHSVGHIAANHPHKKLYWFLISKGHRTYMFLPLFFNKFIPDKEGDCQELKQILNITSQKMFSKSWDPEKGLICFDTSLGELKPELAAKTFKKKDHPYVGFFLQKNPKFYQGDELACLAEVSTANLKGFAQRFFTQGLSKAMAYEL